MKTLIFFFFFFCCTLSRLLDVVFNQRVEFIPKANEKVKASLVGGSLWSMDQHVCYCLSVMQWKKEMTSQEGPPGYEPIPDTKPKTKSVKRNERKKEKRLQVCHLLIVMLFLNCTAVFCFLPFLFL